MLFDTFLDFMESWPSKWKDFDGYNVTEDMVRRSYSKYILEPDDFLNLLSPCAKNYLEDMAQRAHNIRLRHFGRAVNIFTPLYISDFCTNQCRYCGFNAKNIQKRRHLSIEEVYLEAQFIASQGFKHILLLTGEAKNIASIEYIVEVVRKIKPLFSSIGIEIYSVSTEEYKLLVEAGVDSMTMFQETYDAKLYDWLHPVGPKKDYVFRLTAPERAAKAGMRFLGIGALLGLNNFISDAFATAMHAWWLQQKFQSIDISVSIPRICDHEGEFEVKHGLDDVELVQYVIALRLFLGSIGITCSSRESSFMRDHLIPLGVTRVSAGVSTAVGGRVTENWNNKGQFEINDHRSLREMVSDLSSIGYQAVMKDWEDPSQ